MKTEELIRETVNNLNEESLDQMRSRARTTIKAILAAQQVIKQKQEEVAALQKDLRELTHAELTAEELMG